MVSTEEIWSADGGELTTPYTHTLGHLQRDSFRLSTFHFHVIYKLSTNKPLITANRCLASSSTAIGSLHCLARCLNASVATWWIDSELLRHCATHAHRDDVTHTDQVSGFKMF